MAAMGKHLSEHFLGFQIDRENTVSESFFFDKYLTENQRVEIFLAGIAGKRPSQRSYTSDD